MKLKIYNQPAGRDPGQFCLNSAALSPPCQEMVRSHRRQAVAALCLCALVRGCAGRLLSTTADPPLPATCAPFSTTGGAPVSCELSLTAGYTFVMYLHVTA